MSGITPSNDVKLDNFQDAGFFAFIRDLPQKADTTIGFFDRGDYYTVHGADALFTAKEIFKTTAGIKMLGSGDCKMESLCVSRPNFDSMLRELLLVRHYRLEVYGTSGGKAKDWTITKKASPGNLTQFEDVLFNNIDMSSSAGVLAVKVVNSADSKHKVVGVGYADATLRQLGVSEFPDNEEFTNLEALLVQLSPKECIIPSDAGPEAGRLQQVLSRAGMLVSSVKKGDFTAKDNVQDLTRLLKVKKGSQAPCATWGSTENQVAMASVAALIKYLQLLGDEANFGQFTFMTFDLSQYMKLDSAAVRALNLLPSIADRGNKTGSLLGLLNHCRTAQGQRLLAQWIKQPLMDKHRIEERLNCVEAFVSDTEMRHSLHEDYIRRIPDLQRLAKKFQRKKATLQDCYCVYQAVEKIPWVVEALEKHDGDHTALLAELFCKPIKELLVDFAKFQEMVEATLDLSAVDSHEFRIKADFDENLQAIKENMEQLEKDIQKEMGRAARDLNVEANKVLKLESNTQMGYFFRVTRKEEKALRNNRSYTIIDTNKNGVRFRNSSLKNLNTEYLQAKENYTEQQASVVAEIIEIAAGYCDPMLVLNDIIAQVDVLVSFSHAAVNAPIPYVRPDIKDKGTGVLKLKEARHPCLEMQDDIAFIPNDATFQQDGKLFHIITGPNMGGKSTYIRSVGVCVVMAQLGCFVPCASAEISVMDRVLARVGAGDNLSQAMSTFMAEMLETSTILQSATASSLVIIDELGRGTSTYDGFGLAWAIAKHIAVEIRAFAMFATHFHELTALADEVESVNNLHVTALTAHNTFTLLYKVKPGVCDQSFGIHVAELAHFPKHVIQFAKEKAAELDDYQHISLMADNSDEPAAKKIRLDRDEGEKLVEDFIAKVKAIPLETMSEEEAFAQLTKLKAEIASKDNSYIKSILERVA